jgi:hypothetical protein
MDRRVIISGKGVNIPWGGVSKYHGKVGVYTIGGVIDILLPIETFGSVAFLLAFYL